MELVVKQVKTKLLPEREQVIDDILEEYPSVNSDQVEEEADRRMLQRYVDQFIKTLQNYMTFFYHLKKSDVYRTLIDIVDESIEEDYEMINEKELDVFIQTIADNRELYEDLF